MQQKHLYLLSVLSGIIFTLGWPMNGFPFLLFFGFVPLLFVLDHLDANPRLYHKYSVFQFSYLAFFTFNLLSIYWIWNSTIFGGIMALLLSPLFMTTVIMVYYFSKRAFFKGSNSIYLLVFYWVSYEYLNLDWDLSWPWLNMGNGFAMYTKWVQWYEFTGLAGGTLWILWMNILIYKIIKNLIQKVNRTRLTISLVKAVFVFVVPMVFSLYIYSTYQEKGEVAEVIVVQPNIDPWSEQYVLPPSKIVSMNFDLVRELITPETDFVVCPESAIQEDIWHASIEKSRSLVLIRRFMNEYPKVNVLIGASTFRLFDKDEPLSNTARKFSDVDKYYEAFNTTLYLSKNQDVGMYHKSKLVPGPEKMPFQRFLRPLQNFAFDLGGTIGSLGFSPEREVFESADGRFKVPGIICYESIYGDFVNGFVRNGANLLFVITNDGWWGNTAGHRQHFTFSKIRAIETRRDVARSANTGISGFIDQRGDVIARTAYWEPAVLKADLHANEELTFYVVFGDYLGRISTFIAVFMILISISVSMVNKPRKRGSRVSASEED